VQHSRLGIAEDGHAEIERPATTEQRAEDAERRPDAGVPAARGPAARYRAFLAVPGNGRLLVSAVAGRLPLGMSSLAILLLVRLQSGSFALAGVAVGAFTLSSAVTSPAQGRLVDRVGGPPVLVGFAIAQASGMAGLVLAAELRAPSAVLVGLAAIAGAMTPPLSACMRALWPRVAPTADALETAYQLDATSQEVIWTAGPLLVGVVVAAGSPVAAVLLSAAITITGTVWFATAPATRQWRGIEGSINRPSALSNSGLRILLVTMLLAGLGIGAVEVALPAVAVHAGSRAGAGILLGLWSIGSLLGGLAHGARAWRSRLTSRYPALLLLVALTTGPLIFASGLAASLPLSLLAGVALAPMMGCQYALVGAVAARGTATEAFAWSNTALVAGVAAGNATAGPLAQVGDITRAFALACLSFALASIVALVSRRRIQTAVTHGE
jgi:Major Facilitator Superfamily